MRKGHKRIKEEDELDKASESTNEKNSKEKSLEESLETQEEYDQDLWEDLEETEEPKPEDDFSFSDGMLVTNKNIVEKKPKPLELELEEEYEEKVSEDDKDKDKEKGLDVYGVRIGEGRDEEEDTPGRLYDAGERGGDVYNTSNSSDVYSARGEDLYSASPGGAGPRSSSIYTTGESVYTTKMGAGEVGPRGFYDPRDDSNKNQFDKDWVGTKKPSSGLEEIGSKAKKVRMGYESSGKKGRISYN